MLLQIDDKIEHFKSHEEAISYLIGNGTVNKFEGWTPELLSYEYSGRNDDVFSQWDRDSQILALEEHVLDEDEIEQIAREHCEIVQSHVKRNPDPPADVSPVDDEDYRHRIDDTIIERVNQDAFAATCDTLVDEFIQEQQERCREMIHDFWPEYDPR
jgi:hypothetical protein